MDRIHAYNRHLLQTCTPQYSTRRCRSSPSLTPSCLWQPSAACSKPTAMCSRESMPSTLLAVQLLIVPCRLAYMRKFASAGDHKKLSMSKEDMERMQETMTSKEADAWSLFQNNTMFFLLFSFMAFY